MDRETKYYRDADGNFLGGYGDGADPPGEAIECPAPPHGRALWREGAWVWDQAAFDRESATAPFVGLLAAFADNGWLTINEAMQWAAGTIPASVLAVVPAPASNADLIRLARPEVVRRTDPVIIAFAASFGADENTIDQAFSAANE